MSAELLREAARKMRERAESATQGDWYADAAIEGDGWVVMADGIRRAHLPDRVDGDRENASHIASWHPAVALAVADWLDAAALSSEIAADRGLDPELRYPEPFAVARAYLGGDA